MAGLTLPAETPRNGASALCAKFKEEGDDYMQGRRSSPIPSGNAPGPMAPTQAKVQLVNSQTLRLRAAQTMRAVRAVRTMRR